MIKLLLQESQNRIRSPTPDNDISARIARQHIATLIEADACHILWFFSSLKNAQTLVESAALVERPEGQMIFASCHQLIAIEWMELNCNDSVNGALSGKTFQLF